MDDSVQRTPGVIEPMRADFIPTSDYTSQQFLQLENSRMWPRAWHVACREEELPDVGSYLTFDICEQSITLVRTATDKIKAFYNVCMHRGRRLTEGHGRITRFHCSYHGSQYDLDGRITRVQDRQDWQGCPAMEDSDISLREVETDTWAGFVFVNMDPDCEPLARFLGRLRGRRLAEHHFRADGQGRRGKRGVELPSGLAGIPAGGVRRPTGPGRARAATNLQ